MTNTKDPDLELADRAINLLTEHFDTVQVFLTRHDPDGGTVSVCRGVGNHYARLGQVSDWMEKTFEEARESVRPERGGDGAEK